MGDSLWELFGRVDVLGFFGFWILDRLYENGRGSAHVNLFVVVISVCFGFIWVLAGCNKD